MTTPNSRSVLVLGGARSGKSRFAETMARETGLERVYLATGRAWDDEMRARIATHKADRADDGWITHEEPLDLIGALKTLDQPGRVILVDCLTLWVTNLMMEEGCDVDAEGESLSGALSDLQATVILVSNEVGLGIVPENKMARAFRDHAGRLHQAIAAEADEVYFVAAGLPLKMKG
ncbi:adenosylcobinamide kinase/adenosylcobinamide-phosphate guanylyltransferase [Peteryoungia aggregata LMG 23059]|uniref:Bifunctional adenosylcobalamin biosynthesis protein n=1 Tax=Peteryoungia aggregata LMG 23059 TaxID=1368425 RepID=A0ABU0G6U6_9HYPH|nr:bifunctional adenosylcobinamide kinase/adenosylcobinamide-phosphate guanylyltransferase [Peteryoungia aggregata]MDQ0421069.1 adenosylcobinamide kinase/adenosylcobinamide-phosphate guanylyltransferase [Peteryoungia aggregata LMG 23059]